MNDMTPADTSTALTLPAAADLAEMLKAENGLDGLLSQLEMQARAEAKDADAATKKGRDALKSIAFRVSKSKVSLEDRAKELTEAQRKAIEAVNAGRNAAVKRLEALRDEIKKPALDWEAAEEERIEALKARVAMIATGGIDATSASSDIQAQIDTIAAMQGDDFAEYAEIATAKLAQTLDTLNGFLIFARNREENERELAALRAAAAEREAADAARRAEEEAKAEAERAAEQQRLEAEAKRISDEKAEAERQSSYADILIQHVADVAIGKIGGEFHPFGILAYELSTKIEGELVKVGPHADRVREARDKALASLEKDMADQEDRRREQEAEKAEADKMAAVEAERARAAAAAEAIKRAEEKRAADVAHISKIRGEAKAELMKIKGINEALAVNIVLAINGKCIPHISIAY